MHPVNALGFAGLVWSLAFCILAADFRKNARNMAKQQDMPISKAENFCLVFSAFLAFWFAIAAYVIVI